MDKSLNSAECKVQSIAGSKILSGKMCGAWLQFPSRLLKMRVQSPVKNDEVPLQNFAAFVTRNDNSWKEFISEVRGL